MDTNVLEDNNAIFSVIKEWSPILTLKWLGWGCCLDVDKICLESGRLEPYFKSVTLKRSVCYSVFTHSIFTNPNGPYHILSPSPYMWFCVISFFEICLFNETKSFPSSLQCQNIDLIPWPWWWRHNVLMKHRYSPTLHGVKTWITIWAIRNLHIINMILDVTV
jgi:hypothetical protein